MGNASAVTEAELTTRTMSIGSPRQGSVGVPCIACSSANCKASRVSFYRCFSPWQRMQRLSAPFSSSMDVLSRAYLPLK